MSQLRDFIGVAERDQSCTWFYVTLDPVLMKAAKSEIANCGKDKIEDRSCPRHQLWSIKDDFDRGLPELPNAGYG